MPKNNKPIKNYFSQSAKSLVILFMVIIAIFIFTRILGGIENIAILIISIMLLPIVIVIFVLLYRWIIEFKKPWEDRFWRNYEIKEDE